MKSFLTTFITFLIIFPTMGQDIKTFFEKSNGNRSASYEEVIKFYEELAREFPTLTIEEKGMTDSGKPLHLVTFDATSEFNIQKAKNQDKLFILILNGIHPGEPDGIDATMMFIRDILTDENTGERYKDAILGIIPVYNIGGALNRNSTTRANQNGPENYGFRGNARNYDLNRDFIKLDTRNAKSFVEIYQEFQPDIFIDNHVSNGADYQYVITHLATQHNKLPKEMGTYLQDTMIPDLENLMDKSNSPITPYVNVFNTTPDKGFSQFMDYPRYSTGYTSLFHTLGFMVETHMLKPYDQRVEATYHFMENLISIGIRDRKNILSMINKFRNNPFEDGMFITGYELNKEKSSSLNFKGYEGRVIESEITNQDRLFYDRDKPYEKIIPYYNFFEAGSLVSVPKAYIIPRGWHHVIENLKVNGVKLDRIKKAEEKEVEVYTIIEYETSKRPYEGHFPHSKVKVSTKTETVTLSEGDYIAYTNQTSGKYLMQVLEPEADDSFFKWNYFDTILQQKEHFSPYVFEDIAGKILEENPNLKKRFEAKKASDEKFANSGYRQLNFIYEGSKFHEKAHMRYPIYRVIE